METRNTYPIKGISAYDGVTNMDFSLKNWQTVSPTPLSFTFAIPLTSSINIAVFAAPIALTSFGHLDERLKHI